MSYDFRMPQISGSDREQLAQLKSYLYQFIPQLQWALNSLETSSASNASNYVAPQTQNSSATQSSSSKAPTIAFDELKALIIKSADIVDAYYEEIETRLSGSYVAESDFGTFVEQTEQTTKETATGVEKNFTNIQQILTDIENVSLYLAEVDAHIHTGILYYDSDGLPVYGLEIGQKNTVDGEEIFNKYARFTSDKLSFYDKNGTEVAYVSDYKLYIRNVEITSSFKIGGLVDTVMASGDVVTKWTGGNGQWRSLRLYR